MTALVHSYRRRLGPGFVLLLVPLVERRLQQFAIAGLNLTLCKGNVNIVLFLFGYSVRIPLSRQFGYRRLGGATAGCCSTTDMY